MSENKYREINIGRIAGFSSYELAVMQGKFEGSEEEYVDKEQKVYDDMVEYCEQFKLDMKDVTLIPQQVASRMNDLGLVSKEGLDTIYSSYSGLQEYHVVENGAFTYTCTLDSGMCFGTETETNGIQVSISWVTGMQIRYKKEAVWADWESVVTTAKEEV